jgi:hypothetical protein
MPCWWNWRSDLVDRRKCVMIFRADPWNREESRSYIVAPGLVNGDEAVRSEKSQPPGNRAQKRLPTASLKPLLNTPTVSSFRPISLIALETFFRCISTLFFVTPSAFSPSQSASNQSMSHSHPPVYPGAPLGGTYLTIAKGVWCLKNASGIDLDCLAVPAEREAGEVADLEMPACVGSPKFAGGCDLRPSAGGMEERRATLLLGSIARIP